MVKARTYASYTYINLDLNAWIQSSNSVNMPFLKKIKQINTIFNNISIIENIIKEQLIINDMKQRSLVNTHRGTNNIKMFDKEIIISLTTHGRRIHSVHLTIESLMCQTIKPNKIILWLSEKEFSNNKLPLMLKKYEDRGLEILFTRDLRSYTKLLPCLKEHQDDIIITVDDDIIYDYNMVENLIREYSIQPDLIHFCRGHRMIIKNKILLPYKKWLMNIEKTDITLLNFPTGVGGVLYPPHSLSEEVFNEKVFLDMCPSADDVWFKAMALLKDSNSKKVHTRIENGLEYVELKELQNSGLRVLNVDGNKNDEQIEAVFKRYSLHNKLI